MQPTKYLALPPEITQFERRFLAHINKVALIFFYLHIPVLMAVAWAAGTGPITALVLSAIVLIGPTIAYRTIKNPRSISVVYGITAMFMGGLLVHFGQGPLQIEMHFYFFALLAMLCLFANPTVNLAAAGTVVVHHLVVWWLLPSSVFNYNAQWWVVLVHTAFVILETVAACYISREFFDNVIGLEKIVEARTVTIREHQRDMRLILNNLQEGLVTIEPDGRISGEISRTMKDWFGASVDGEKLGAWIGRKDALFSEWLDLALEAVQEGILPLEVTLAQLPTRLEHGDRSYAVQYQLMTNINEAHESGLQRSTPDGLPGKILVIVTDTTEMLAREVAERHQGDLLRVFQHMMRDKAGLFEFLKEADALIGSLNLAHSGDLDHLKLLIHTLKGNAAIFGMQRVSEICYSMENQMRERGEAPAITAMAELERAWGQIRSDAQTLIGEARDTNIEIDHSEYNTILLAIRAGVDVTILARMVESWQMEPTRNRLERVEQQIIGLAERMGKSHIVVSIVPNGLRFDSDRFAPFWFAFIHVLRNTVDHGVESREERRKSGKPDKSSIRITTEIAGDSFLVIVEDDGPGVDWDRLLAKADKLGLSTDGYAKSAKLLCLPGLSSKELSSTDTNTELSGRGVGMAALADVCEPLGGTITVESVRGLGTRIQFAFPKDRGIYEGHEALLKSSRRLVAA